MPMEPDVLIPLKAHAVGVEEPPPVAEIVRVDVSEPLSLGVTVTLAPPTMLTFGRTGTATPFTLI